MQQPNKQLFDDNMENSLRKNVLANAFNMLIRGYMELGDDKYSNNLEDALQVMEYMVKDYKEELKNKKQ